MASKQEGADEEETERDVMKEAAENLASVKETLAAIDDLNARWEVDRSSFKAYNCKKILHELYTSYVCIFIRLSERSSKRLYECL